LSSFLFDELLISAFFHFSSSTGISSGTIFHSNMSLFFHHHRPLPNPHRRSSDPAPHQQAGPQISIRVTAAATTTKPAFPSSSRSPTLSSSRPTLHSSHSQLVHEPYGRAGQRHQPVGQGEGQQRRRRQERAVCHWGRKLWRCSATSA
jgi:hypothetical protein